MKLGLLTSIREDATLPGESFIKRQTTNLAPMYLAAYLEKTGVEIEILIKDKLEDLISFQPDILGISSVTENFEFAKKLAKKAKALWNPITILGGVHITSLPKTLPLEFDIGVIGEGEKTLSELILCIQETGCLPKEGQLKQVDGIVFHSEGGIKRTLIRKTIKNLDEIPIPSREKFINKMGSTYMMTSRGCPYTCDFCVIPSLTEGYRKASPDYVVEEIKSIKQHFDHVKHIRIFDDLYIVDKKRVAAIADRVAAEGLNQELNFGCWGRANLIDQEMVKTFQKMNMLYVAFGAESGSSRVLSHIKPGCSLEENQRTIELLSDNGIRVSCSVILGHPLETEDDLWATYEFIEKNLDKLFEVEFNVAIPWPGTDLWHQALKRGLVHEGMDFAPLKECAHFPNYCTDLYPYLNERIPPERFDVILVEFKKLYKKLAQGMVEAKSPYIVNPEQHIATLL